MAALKRALDDSQPTHKAKKTKITDAGKTKPGKASHTTTNFVTGEVDFPRGGGTSFTPLEVKGIRAEAVKEANEELFEDAKSQPRAGKKRKRKSEAGPPAGEPQGVQKSDRIRIEHLNYKRMNVDMKILGQIVSIQPLGLVVSLPNQLFGHVPITNISSQLTTLLETMDQSDDEPVSEEEEDEEKADSSRVLDLSEVFREGQYVRCVVNAVYAPGATDISGIGKSQDETTRASRRVELSLIPKRVNVGVQKSDLRSGFTITGAVQSIEDHGYILDLGVPDVAGFLSFKDAKQEPSGNKKKFYIGQLLDAVVRKMSSNGRTCNVAISPDTFSTSFLSEVTSATSVLPGTLVQTLITAVHSTGINLQVLGFFEGTVDQTHLHHGSSEKSYKVGKKVKARVLYDFSSAPPRFALTLAEHVVGLVGKKTRSEDRATDPQTIQKAYPIGTILEQVKVQRVETDRGLILEIGVGIEGFVHISHVSDDHVPTLTSSSGPWKSGSIHRARVTGYFAFDGLLQLSLKKSVLEQKFLQVSDVEVGEVIKGTIKKLTDIGLFVSMSGNLDGIIRPNHFADITLKQPSKRFKPGASIKCRVLVVDPDRKRISLTAKKTLLDSTLPVLSNIEDTETGIITYATVFKVYDNHLMVEFYNNLKAMVPKKELSEASLMTLSDAFPIGKVVKVRIIAVEKDQGHIIASIRQAAPNFNAVTTDISGVEIGNIVEGTVADIHKDNAILTLEPTKIRALISLKNLANHRSLSLPQLRVVLKVNDRLDQLVVVTRNTEKGFVIVANKPKSKESLPSKNSLSMESITIGQIVIGRVTRHTRQGTLIKIASHIGGILYPTDTSDNFDTGEAFPAIDSIIKAAVVGIDQAKKQLTLSTRHSKLYPDRVTEVIDRETNSISDLEAGVTVRGFIKSVAEHGLFVTVGRDIDARVQIRELFDEYIKEWQQRFKPNQLVKGRILSVDLEAKKIELSFRTNITNPSSTILSIGDIQIGQKVDGTIKRIEDYGLFIQIEGSKLTGLCHKSQLSDNKDADVTVALRGFREGDHVKAMVLAVEKRRISLSLKPSHFSEEDFETNEDSEVEESEKEQLGTIGKDLEMFGVNSEEGVGERDDEDEEASDDDDENTMEVDVDEDAHIFKPSKPVPGSSKPVQIPSLQLSGGFQWSSSNLPEGGEMNSDSSEDESEVDGQPSKQKKRKRKEIEYDLTADMHTKTPESNADFERVLLGSPNSSFIWIQYMSFQLQLSEMDKAREIARRAIRTINFREEQERLNVWIALLNLENVYGTDETVESVFKEAAQANDSKTVHLRLASIFDQTDKHQKAEEQYKRTCKKFGYSSKVWTSFGEYYLRRGDLEEARKLLPRSLQSLDKRKHLKSISRFAQLEYKHGEAERGKTVFEGIVDSHPKRWDLWSIYMDMEAGQGDIQSLRNLFDRVLAIRMTSHKAKSFFKKWLQLERKLGDEEGAEIVKQKAVEWTQKANAS